MRLFIIAIILVAFMALINGCIKRSPKMGAVEGGLYATPKENNEGYNIIKIRLNAECCCGAGTRYSLRTGA